MDIERIISLSIAIIGGLTGIGAFIRQWMKEASETDNLAADSAQKLSDAAVNLNKPLLEMIERLEKRQKDRDAEISELAGCQKDNTSRIISLQWQVDRLVAENSALLLENQQLKDKVAELQLIVEHLTERLSKYEEIPPRNNRR